MIDKGTASYIWRCICNHDGYSEDRGEWCGWWCPAVRCRVDYDAYPPCGRASWEPRKEEDDER